VDNASFAAASDANDHKAVTHQDLQLTLIAAKKEVWNDVFTYSFIQLDNLLLELELWLQPCEGIGGDADALSTHEINHWNQAAMVWRWNVCAWKQI
jgi:hypothetical protein